MVGLPPPGFTPARGKLRNRGVQFVGGMVTLLSA
jgi:hypothetical protein